VIKANWGRGGASGESW